MGRPDLDAISERAAARGVLRLDGDNIEAAADIAALLAYARELEAERDRLATALAAYADLPPEPEPSALAAFLDVLAIDNCPGDKHGGGDCGPATEPPELLRTHPFKPHPYRGGCAECGEPSHHPSHRRTA